MPRKPAKNAAPVYGISQLELGTYRAVSADVKRLTADRESRRKSLMARVLEGASIEPGLLEPHVNTTEVVRVTNGEIERLLGVDVLLNLKAQIAPVVQRSFSVTEAAEARAAG